MYIAIFNVLKYQWFYYRVRHLTFFFQLVLISWMVTLSSCLILVLFFRQNEYGCVYVWRMLTEDADFGKTSSFQMKIILIWRVYKNKQNCWIWGTENQHAYIETATHSKRVTVWCRFWSGSIIRPFFFENEQGEAGTVNGDRSCWTNFCSQKLKRRILATFGFNRTALRATHPKLHSMFCSLFLKIAYISRTADVVWPTRSCDLIPLNYYLWGAVKDKCYADKSETVDALKDNICKAIGEI